MVYRFDDRDTNRFLTIGPENGGEVLYDEPIEVLIGATQSLAQYEQIPGLS